MYKTKINDDITLQLSSDIGTYRNDKFMEITGIEVKGKEYSINDLQKKIKTDITEIAEKQMTEFLNTNADNKELINKYSSDSKISLISHEVKKASIYAELKFNELHKNILTINVDRKKAYLNLLDWTYKAKKSVWNEKTKVYEHVLDDDLTGFIYTDYRDEHSLLLKQQLEKGTADPIFYKCQKIHDFLEGKKTAKIICEDHEMLVKDYNCSLRPFSIDDNNNLTMHDYCFNYAFRDCKEKKVVTIKHGRKSISFTVNTSVDDVKEG